MWSLFRSLEYYRLSEACRGDKGLGVLEGESIGTRKYSIWMSKGGRGLEVKDCTGPEHIILVACACLVTTKSDLPT